jgi:hypothetical protein
MKALVIKLIDNVFRLHFLFLVKPSILKKAIKSNGILYVLDIDNTLANTWPSFNKNSKNEKARLESLEPLHGVIQFVQAQTKNQNYIFLSARLFAHYNTTIQWLQKNGFKASSLNTILVSNAKEKLFFLNRMCKETPDIKIIYIDDLSYNHEKGIIKYYDDVINHIKQMPLEYIGYNEILALNIKA